MLEPIEDTRQRLGNRLYYLLRKAHVPWAYAIPIVSGIKTALHPIDHVQRRRAAGRTERLSLCLQGP